MSSFMETYGKALFVLVLMAILISFATPVGVIIKRNISENIEYLGDTAESEITNSNNEEKVVVGNVEKYKKVNGMADGNDLVQSQYIVPNPIDFGLTEDYVFTGWYTNNNYKNVYTKTSGIAYSRFNKIENVMKF